jgi:UDP-N-acetylglucosamine 2-epimerase (non-hydrolysing)
MVAAKVLDELSPVLASDSPAAVLVQGDTTTALAGALAAYYHQIPVGHVEAGLRTHDLDHPFPEEGNRQLVDRLCRWCFAPTSEAQENLLRENIPGGRIQVTGNTGIDALFDVLRRTPLPTATDPYVLVTLHRRESFGPPMRDIVGGLTDFLSTTPSARVVWPVHPNPALAELLGATSHVSDRLTLLPPRDYSGFVGLMAGCRLILTDSGGVQEEAPSLGKRVLVARETTERPEAVASGQNRLIGRTRGRVTEELKRAWSEPAYDGPIPAPNPFGDGRAAGRIVSTLTQLDRAEP